MELGGVICAVYGIIAAVGAGSIWCVSRSTSGRRNSLEENPSVAIGEQRTSGPTIEGSRPETYGCPSERCGYGVLEREVTRDSQSIGDVGAGATGRRTSSGTFVGPRGKPVTLPPVNQDEPGIEAVLVERQTAAREKIRAHGMTLNLLISSMK